MGIRIPDIFTAMNKQLGNGQMQEAMDAYNAALVGKIVDVIYEGTDEIIKYSYGRTYADAPEIDGLVFVSGDAPLGEIVPVQITGTVGDYDLIGSSLNKK